MENWPASLVNWVGIMQARPYPHERLVYQASISRGDLLWFVSFTEGINFKSFQGSHDLA